MMQLRIFRCSADKRFCRLFGLLLLLPGICLSATPDHHLEYDLNKISIKRDISRMSTRVEFTILTADKIGANKAIDLAIAEIDRISVLMSEWTADSAVSAINQAAGKHPVRVPEELFRLLEEAKKLSQITQGKFDITFAGIGKLWNFRKAEIPSTEKITAAIKLIDYKKLHLNVSNRTAYLEKQSMKIGLGGIVKGYIVDRAAQVIRQAGFTEFSINAGGDLYVSGDKGGKQWRVGIQSPRDKKAILVVIPVANTAVATSGDYERFFMLDGQRYSHIIDPQTGYPANKSQSVTVLAPRAYQADALATGVFVLGPKAGMKLIESLNEVEALIVSKDGGLSLSSGLREN